MAETVDYQELKECLRRYVNKIEKTMRLITLGPTTRIELLSLLTLDTLPNTTKAALLVKTKSINGCTAVSIALQSQDQRMLELIFGILTIDQRYGVLMDVGGRERPAIFTVPFHSSSEIVTMIFDGLHTEQKFSLLTLKHNFLTFLGKILRGCKPSGKMFASMIDGLTSDQCLQLLKSPTDSSRNSAHVHLIVERKNTLAADSFFIRLTPENAYDALTLKDTNGSSALHLEEAYMGQTVDLTRILLDKLDSHHKFKLVATQDNQGSTPLHIAALTGSLEATLYMLSGLTPEERYRLLISQNKFGHTPLHCAAHHNVYIHFFEQLIKDFKIQQQINLLSMKSVDGNTPNDVAVARNGPYYGVTALSHAFTGISIVAGCGMSCFRCIMKIIMDYCADGEKC